METKEFIVYENEQYLFLHLETQDGERRYNHKSVHILPPDQDAKQYAEDYPKDFWAGMDKESDDGWYWSYGEICTRLYNYKTLTREEYDVLRKFL